MTCGTCGTELSAATDQCPSCGTHSGTTTLPGTPPDATTAATRVVSSWSMTQAETLSSTQVMTRVGAEPLRGRLDVQGGPRIGESFGPRYHIIKLLGTGGMGAVYQALDAELNVGVALKVIRTDRRQGTATPEAERRFKNELLLARQVTHKNVVRIHDLGEIEGIKYITMPYIKGDDLATVLRRDGPMPTARALAVARQLAAGLAAAHEAGVVHRDLKPANIMISATADGLHAQIMDFGISVSSSDAGSGGVIGTLEYMAPEQSTGSPVDARADIYAFGLILYEMLTGPRRAAGTGPIDRIDAMRRRCQEGLAPLRTVDPTIPEPLERLVARCLEIDPAARFQTTTELCAALTALDDAGQLIPPPRYLTRRLTGAVTLVVAALVALTYYLAYVPPVVQHDPVSVVIADFDNRTGDPAFDRTLEPMLKLALEGAGFISAYDRSVIGRSLGVRPPETLDERAALEVAVKQGLGVVISGAVERQGRGYGVSIKATQAVTGNVIANVVDTASGKNQVLGVAAALADDVREALGDDTPEADKRFDRETLSATSLEVVRDYAAAAQAMSSARYEEALGHFSRAAQRDPGFGLAHAGMAIASRNLDRQQDAEKYIKQAVSQLDGMTERERYRTRGLYYMITGDSGVCVKEFSDLIARYAADASARNNLALCLTYQRKMPEALGEMQQVVKILPRRALYRENLATYAAYAGDFETAEREALVIEDPSQFALLAVAFAQVGRGEIPQAIATYQAIGKMEELGASYQASGLGDIALYEGRFADAARIFSEGAAADLASKDADRAANKFAALAYTQMLRRQPAAATAAAERALANSTAVKIRFLAARVFVEAGAAERTRSLAASLGSELQAEPQAYAKIIEGEAALTNGDSRQAIKLFGEANALLDTWIGHFDLGRAFLEAGAFTQADSEFDRCLRRRGETLALFLDEEPTYGYFPPVYYYQGRVREGLGSAGAAESYRSYLSIRGQSKEDPLLPDVRRRAGG